MGVLVTKKWIPVNLTPPSHSELLGRGACEANSKHYTRLLQENVDTQLSAVIKIFQNDLLA